MESNPTQTPTQYKSVTVDVPEERIAEFHAFFARFLAGGRGRGHRGRHGRPHRGPHGRGCAERRAAAKRDQASGQSAEVTEV